MLEAISWRFRRSVPGVPTVEASAKQWRAGGWVLGLRAMNSDGGHHGGRSSGFGLARRWRRRGRRRQTRAENQIWMMPQQGAFTIRQLTGQQRKPLANNYSWKLSMSTRFSTDISCNIIRDLKDRLIIPVHCFYRLLIWPWLEVFKSFPAVCQETLCIRSLGFRRLTFVLYFILKIL